MFWSPFISHHKPKLQINVQTQKWHCWVSNQGGHNLFQLFKKLKASKEHFDELVELVGDKKYVRKNTNKEDKKIVRLPNEFKPLWLDGNSIIRKHAIVYLKNRGITLVDVIRYGMGYCEEGLYANRIIVPSYSSDGELNYFVGRDIYEGGMKYKNPPVSKDIIGFDLFINWDEPIILCEGVFDAMSFKRNAIPLFGKTVMNTLNKKIIESKVKVIYLSLDSDAINDAVKISENFINNGIDVRMMEFNEKDPNDIGFEKLLYLIKRTQTTRFSDLMKIKLNGTRKKHMEI